MNKLRHYAKWNKPVTKEKILYDSTWVHEVPRVTEFIEEEGRTVVPGAVGEGMGVDV